MATARTVAAIAAVLALAATACGGDDKDAAPQPTTVSFPEVGLQLHVPAELADLTYEIGKSEEGQPTLLFSSKQMETVGGPSCAAGAESAVSPYPLGQIVVSEETPEHVREEAKENPEEHLGTFVAHAGDHYLFYIAPPDEPCVSDDADAASLQLELTARLKSALKGIQTAA